jgi:hypothetical protein
MSGFGRRDDAIVYDLTWSQAMSWHAARCACPGQFEQLARFHLESAGIRVLPHPSTAVLSCTWAQIAMPARGAGYGAVHAASRPLFLALRRSLTRQDVERVRPGDAARSWERR